jgi:hypothetical protein
MGNRRLGAQRLQAMMKRGAAELDSSKQAGAGIKDAIVSHKMYKFGGVIETQILVDLQGKGSSIIHSADTDQDVIGATTDATDEAAALAAAIEGAHLLQWSNSIHGRLFEAEIICTELPAGGTLDIDVVFETYAAGNKLGTAITSPDLLLLAGGGNIVEGDRHIIPIMDEDLDNASPEVTAIPALTDVDTKGLYLTGADLADGAQYTAGKLLIILRGYDTSWGF